MLDNYRCVVHSNQWAPSWLGLSHIVTEDMIREIFSSRGEVLEICMMKDQNGALKVM